MLKRDSNAQQRNVDTLERELNVASEKIENQGKFIDTLMVPYRRARVLARRRLLKAYRDMLVKSVDGYKKYSVAELITIIQTNASSNYDDVDVWTLMEYKRVSGIIHLDPKLAEVLQVYRYEDANYQEVFHRVYKRRPTPEELASVEVAFSE